MFGWLAKMLLKTPVVGSCCPCCEAKREHLEKMRQNLLKAENDRDNFCESEKWQSASLKIMIDGETGSQKYMIDDES